MQTPALFFNKHTYTKKREILAAAIDQLKLEFIGIDGIIDELGNVIMSWWLFPEYQIRPLIINLWGMTGSGKTALIQRLSEIIEANNYILRFDMGEFGSTSTFLKYVLTRQLSQFDGTNPIIVLDEFQFAKTKDESGKEVNNNSLRIIWDLLDSGKLTYEPDTNTYYVLRGKNALNLLRTLAKRGVKVKYGLVADEEAETVEKIVKSMDFGYEDSTIERGEGKIPFTAKEIFLSDLFCTGIYETSNGQYSSWREIAEIIKGFNSIEEIRDFLEDVMEEACAFKVMDLSKSLIFVLGNLDEAYSISHSINPDIDADEYRRHTLKITVSDIKSALQSRFRNEQIARLGNNHLIYNAFSHRNFEDLIAMHLRMVNERIGEKFKLKINFTKAVHYLLYAEGVFPTQGVRPVISTIRNLIESNFAKIIINYHSLPTKPTSINWDFKEDDFIISFMKGRTKISEFSIKVLQKINSLRKSLKDDRQAIIAVHESGHALAAVLMVNVLPEYVITRTVDSESEGFAYILLPEEIATAKLLLDRIVIGLGGYVAEELIFGKEYKTNGVSQDLQKVTNTAHQMVREYGMTGLPYKINIHAYGGSTYQFTFTQDLEQDTALIVNQCREKLTEVLLKFKPLLIEMAKYLSDNTRINKPDIKKLVDAYLNKNKLPPIKYIDMVSYYDFRRKLFAME